ncbi:MAG: peptidoglycan recognition family protein, partial [Candidatus Gracilibacteria bacterium]
MKKIYSIVSISLAVLLSITIFSTNSAFADDVTLSDIKKSDSEFTTVGMTWQETAPNETDVDLEARVRQNGTWTGWLTMEKEPSYQSGDYSEYFATLSSNPADAFQYKFTLYNNGISKPVIKNVQWTFIRSAPAISYTSNLLATKGANFALAAGDSGVISREQWGANEDYRYLDDNGTEPDLIEIDDTTYKQFADELKYSRVVEKDSKGNKYKWPLQYPEKVKKVIIHHTATTSDLENPAQAIRDIYYYHAVTRGWGDIGYNYLVDQSGKIYEGRAGGEGVIGAHAGIGNNGSIGIAVLGNYEDTDVPKSVIGALGSFIQKKAKIHDIDPSGISKFRGKDMSNIFGHKDIMKTSCPGTYLYEKLPILRTLAKKQMAEKNKFTKDYDFQDQSDVYYVELTPNEVKDVTIKMENIGKITWDSKTFIVVDDNPAFKDIVTFPSAKGVELARMKESSVKPGDTATFNFQVKAGKKGETVYMNIAPLVNGTRKISDYIVLPVAVQQSDFKYEFIDSKFPATMAPDTTFDAWVKLKNTGNTTWRKTGENTVLLGTDHERDRKS